MSIRAIRQDAGFIPGKQGTGSLGKLATGLGGAEKPDLAVGDYAIVRIPAARALA
jgi:hypothetical protein